MARSVGGAAAEGITSGVGLGLRLRDQQIQEQQLERANANQDEDRATAKADRARQLERQSDDDAMKALDAQHQALLAEGEGLSSQYGANVPPEIGGDFARRKNEITGARDSLLRKRYQPIIDKRQQSMQDLVSRLKTGQVDIDSVPDADLYHAFVTATRRDPKDLLSTDGKPSRVSQAVTDLMTGIQTDNEGMSLAAANVIAEPELKEGVGQPGAHGGTIVSKQIVKLIPNPQNPSEFLPVLKVDVKMPNTRGPAQENGATHSYIAPVTDDRTPDGGISSISVQKAMEYSAQLQTLSHTLDRPDLRKKLERGQAEAAKDPEDFLSAFYALRGKAPAKTIEFKPVPAGGRLVGLDTRTGKVVSQVDGPEKTASGLAGNVDAVQAYADENDMTFEEASALFQKRGLLRAPGKGAAGGAGGGGASSTVPKGVTGPDVLKSLSDDDSTIVQGLADGTVKPSEISQKGNRREQMVALAKRFDPTADFGPNGKMKDVPAPAQKALLENNTNLQRAQRALRLVGGAPPRAGEEGEVDKNATGLKGLLPPWMLNRVDPKGVEARAAIADLGSLILHDRSGAAVTASEFPRLAPFIPGEKDDYETVKKKLRRFVEVYQQETEALQGTYGPDNGYKVFKVGGDKAAGAGIDKVLPRASASPTSAGTNPAAAPAAAAGGAASPPVGALTEGQVTTFRNGQRWTLRNGQAVQVQ